MFDWFNYNENPDLCFGVKKYRMLSLYDHFLSNSEAENMITYVHIKSKIITQKEFNIAEKKVTSFFSELYSLTSLYLFSEKKYTKVESFEIFIEIVRNSCREKSEFVLVIPEFKIVIYSTYDILFCVLEYEDFDNVIFDKIVFKNNLFLLPAK